MTDEYEYTRNLDLLGDWLDAKGYTEEAGLITRSMDYMHKQAERIAGYQKDADDYLIRLDELNALRARIANLEEALSRLLNALNAGIIHSPEEYPEAKRQARAALLETKYD